MSIVDHWKMLVTKIKMLHLINCLHLYVHMYIRTCNSYCVVSNSYFKDTHTHTHTHTHKHTHTHAHAHTHTHTIVNNYLVTLLTYNQRNE